MIRWIYLIKYPEGVPVEDGERWYLLTHTQEARRLTDYGLVGYRTWRALDAPFGTPSRTREQLNEWVRMTELVFESWEGFRAGVIDADIRYTPPSYGPKGFIYETIFLGPEEPEYDLLSEIPMLPEPSDG
jgi:hypothetical protein